MAKQLSAGPPQQTGPVSGPPRRTGRVYLWVPKRLMIDINYLIESFEGLALVRAMDTRLGLMEVMFSPGGEKEIQAVVELITQTYPEIRLAGKSRTNPLV